MTYYPKTQQKLRQEIESEIGDRIPEYEDRNRCHYVMAFIGETLRFRNVNLYFTKTQMNLKLVSIRVLSRLNFGVLLLCPDLFIHIF